jgi:Zn finger protein HypA/HybF involved in hydrogenase expression
MLKYLWRRGKMQKIDSSISFTCPGCKENFEFDCVEEYQFVPCPICGISLMTIRRGQKLQLESFEFNPNDPGCMVDLSEVTTVES